MINKKGFTLIELLIVMAIIGVLTALSIFGLKGIRESGRDAKRKSDLETIRSAVELYKSDCNVYPTTLASPLIGNSSTPACLPTNIYLRTVPTDPIVGRTYIYAPVGATYDICAALENGTGSVSCNGSSTCGTATCNYKVLSP